MFFKFIFCATCIVIVLVVSQTASVAEPNSDFIDQEKICSGLSEKECYANEFCEGRYGASVVKGHIKTADLVFKYCLPSGLNAEEIQLIKNECSNIHGEFIKEEIGGYACLCTKPDYIGKYRCLEDFIFKLKSN